MSICMSLFFYLINIAANVVNRYYRYCQWCRYYRWKQVPALRFISTFSGKFRMIIRIPKKYADNFENRLYRYLRAGLNPKNLFNFYKKSNKLFHELFYKQHKLRQVECRIYPSR